MAPGKNAYTLTFSGGYSDLAIENFAAPTHAEHTETQRRHGFSVLCGRYADAQYHTIFTHNLQNSGARADCTRLVAELLQSYLPGSSRVLLCGLGNPSLEADRLGQAVCAHVPSLGEQDGHRLFVFLPGIPAKTGIPTDRLVLAAAECAQADCILLVDSLCARTPERLGTVIQITDKGLTPGGGVAENVSAEISASTMSRPVVTLGVPTVLRAALPMENGNTRKMLVTDSTIDLLIDQYAAIFAGALTRWFFHI